MVILKLATDEQAERIIKIVGTWLSTTRGHFGDSKTVTKISVAEFLANQEGLTLFASRAE